MVISCVARLLHLELPDKHSRIDDIFPRMFGPLWGSMHIIHSTAMYPDDRAGMYLIIPLVFIDHFLCRWMVTIYYKVAGIGPMSSFQAMLKIPVSITKRPTRWPTWKMTRNTNAWYRPETNLDGAKPAEYSTFSPENEVQKSRFELIFAGYLVCKLCSRMYCAVSWYVAEIVFSIQWHFKSQWEGAEKIGWNVKGTLFFFLSIKSPFWHSKLHK